MEYGQSVETILAELLEGPVGPVNFVEVQRRDAAVAKGLRPKWNDEEPRDFSVASDPLSDVDNALFKATTGRLDPDEATAAIVSDVLKRLAGDDLRKDSDDEPEDHSEDEPKETPADLREDIRFLRAQQAAGKDLYELTNAMLHTDRTRARELQRALAWLDEAA
jgi:hypothetical protein